MMRNRMLAIFLAMWAGFFAAHANDGVYYVSGSHLEPLQETDISVKKEVLTITITDGPFAFVEVEYEFMNNGQPKDVTMGFEARAPYNDDEPMNLKGIHPHINDFSVVMNGKKLNYRNGLVFSEDFDGEWPKETQEARNKGQRFIPVDFKRWQLDLENSERLHNAQTDEYADYAYAYYFDAHFNSRLNTVRHTYSYRMSFSVGQAFEIPYWLTPAMRWANHQIDDFTLRIKVDNCTKHFVIDNSPFEGTPFQVKTGKGKTRVLKTSYDDGSTVTEVVLRNGTLEWHRNNFHTDDNLSIGSAETLEYLVDWGNKPKPLFYDSSDTFLGWLAGGQDYEQYYPGKGTKKQLHDFTARIRRNLPYAHRGYVFKDATLRKIFEQQWWYMPDPSWKPTDNSFSKHEHDLIKASDTFYD
ncbi:MAG: YARHG domain-containing protein [Prevotella sp.]|nr:YARHG domain-containing protein [Prevotella sp.]MBO4658604.1 YARHG domain-containing protein [Prevotella sp.]